MRRPSGRTADRRQDLRACVADHGVEPHPFDDLERGAADVDRVPADPQFGRALDQHRPVAPPHQPVGQGGAGDTRTGDEDGERALHTVKVSSFARAVVRTLAWRCVTSVPDAVGVVLAAGIGTRVGADGNKAYLRLAGRSMVSWSLDP